MRSVTERWFRLSGNEQSLILVLSLLFLLGLAVRWFWLRGDDRRPLPPEVEAIQPEWLSPSGR